MLAVSDIVSVNPNSQHVETPIGGRVMAIDWSWRQPASEYVGLCRELVVNPS